MTEGAEPKTLTELRLNQELKDLINNAYMDGNFPVIVAYVEGDRANVSFRGSVQAYSDQQLSLWARNPEGGILKAMAKNPNLTLVYRRPGSSDPTAGRSLAVVTLRGTGRVVSEESVRRDVYDRQPQIERDADPDYRGLPLIVDLDSVTGYMPGFRLQMQRLI
jgi:hypothetical protein